MKHLIPPPPPPPPPKLTAVDVLHCIFAQSSLKVVVFCVCIHVCKLFVWLGLRVEGSSNIMYMHARTYTCVCFHPCPVLPSGHLEPRCSVWRRRGGRWRRLWKATGGLRPNWENSRERTRNYKLVSVCQVFCNI